MSDSTRNRSSDLNTADIVAIALLFLTFAIMFVSGALDDPRLMVVAAVVSIPAGVLKVLSSRAKHRRSMQGAGEGEPRDRRVAQTPAAAATAR